MKLMSALLALFSVVGGAYGKLFPHVALGGAGEEFEYRLVVQISNVTSSRLEGDVVLLPSDPRRSIWPGEWAVNGEDQTGKAAYLVSEIPPHGSVVLTITGGEDLHTGALLIHTENSWNRNAGGISANVIYQVLRDGALIDTVGVPHNAYHPTQNEVIVLPVSRKSGEHNTGFGFVLMGGSHRHLDGHHNDVLVDLYDNEGSRLGGIRYRFNSPNPGVDHFHLARFVDEAFAQHVETDADFETVTKEEFVGTLHIQSRYGSSLSAIGLCLDWLEGGSIQFTSLPISTYRE
ncbi:MAG: hypothetical protein OXH92_02240 [Bryobacterales bacterium]|nr:hypothetical protein [Bryobacterales bacterium]MDE0432806.1 hypothetical protein [Bryobacterales bacterium]